VSSLPRRALRPARRTVRRLVGTAWARRRRRALLAAGPAEPGRVAVYYGVARLPARDEPVHGGAVKFQELQEALPSTASFNVLYLGSSTVPSDADELVAVARRRGAAFVWNQDGVAYPAWHGPGWERTNEPLARALHAADHVFFQSAFCKLSADRFLGERQDGWEILHNPVDTRRFTPSARPDRPPTLLLGGNQYQCYRFETALRTLALLPPEWRLLVSGAISWSPDRAAARREAARLLEDAGVGDRVELAGTYTQAEAPALLRRADVLLHPKVNDPCPTIVLEAMACGLPVVYSATGGTPELVGPDAGVGVPGPLDWEADRPPAPERLAAGVEEVSARLPAYAEAARTRAEAFDLRPWIDRHRDVFERLVR
jgi:glycosyltransferase involved in cell wall biosynthesis